MLCGPSLERRPPVSRYSDAGGVERGDRHERSVVVGVERLHADRPELGDACAAACRRRPRSRPCRSPSALDTTSSRSPRLAARPSTTSRSATTVRQLPGSSSGAGDHPAVGRVERRDREQLAAVEEERRLRLDAADDLAPLDWSSVSSRWASTRLQPTMHRRRAGSDRRRWPARRATTPASARRRTPAVSSAEVVPRRWK